MSIIMARNPLTQVVAANWATLITRGNLCPTIYAGPMSAPRGSIAVHRAVPYIWFLVTDRTLLPLV